MRRVLGVAIIISGIIGLVYIATGEWLPAVVAIVAMAVIGTGIHLLVD